MVILNIAVITMVIGEITPKQVSAKENVKTAVVYRKVSTISMSGQIIPIQVSTKESAETADVQKRQNTITLIGKMTMNPASI